MSKLNTNPVIQYSKYATISSELLRVTGSKGWANYKYCAPFDAFSRPTKGRCLHSVIVDKNTPTDGYSSYSQMTIGNELFTVIHFEAASAALDAMIEIAGSIKDKSLWINHGFICCQKID